MIADIAIVGGGAAGLFCAATLGAALRHNISITIYEPQKVCGRKLRITGKGRCNVCNACDEKTFLQHVLRNPRFLTHAIYACPPASVQETFVRYGVPLKIERGRRVFPESDDANDIAKALLLQCERVGVRIRHACVQSLLLSPDHQRVEGLQIQNSQIACSDVVLATGGLSYPATGSTGDGYRFAEQCGHSVIAPQGSLVPLESPDPICKTLQGLSLKNVTLRLFSDRDCQKANKALYTELGEMLFTHFGLSGPLVLTASAYCKPGERYLVEIDLKPGLDEEKLDRRILRDFEAHKNQTVSHALEGLCPKSLLPVLLGRAGIERDTRVHAVTAAQRRALVQVCKHLQIPVTGTRPVSEAIITRGGVCTAEIDPRTMQSKHCAGLYFAGEIIDCDAVTGGYNLQIAWSTAYVAATHLAQKYTQLQ